MELNSVCSQLAHTLSWSPISWRYPAFFLFELRPTDEGREVLYLACVNVLVPSQLVLYFYLCSGRRTHNVPIYSFPDKASLVEPYQCVNMNGDFAQCDKASCNGRWKPPRTHHCSSCGVCRLEFDHHCPWVCKGGYSTHVALMPFVRLEIASLFPVKRRSWLCFT